VAIVGRSGAGKSTLASLLLGMHQPSAGRILYDGVDLSELDLRSLRQQVGIVMQNPALFSTSIRSNITLADPSLPLNVVVDAARLAQIHEEILSMPMGYESVLMDRGSRSPERWSESPRSSCWTRRPAPWMPSPRARSNRRWRPSSARGS
jgi:ABC-type bacteriocin/lantibiotic exporter with double-glycine peptidase domain